MTMNKSKNVLYLFDFDGTLVGENIWSGFWKNTLSCLKTGPYINPHKFDIRWSILTGRPKMDKWLVRWICTYKGLFPKEIITAPTWTYQFKSNEDNYKFKERVIKDILEKRGVIQKIYFIDNDLMVNHYLNSHKETYPYIVLTMIDFLRGEFTQLL